MLTGKRSLFSNQPGVISKYVLTVLFIGLSNGIVGNVSADAAKGKMLFGQCSGCHQVGPEAKHLFGPILNGVMQREAASAPDYAYSDALKNKLQGGNWSDESMDAFLAAPMSYAPGTKMAFVGVQSEEDRANLINYLRSIDTDGNSSDAATGVLNESEQSSENASNEPPQERRPATEFAVPEHGVLHLGRLALAEEVQAWDIDVRPDGVGLPVGQGSATVGGELYDAVCASCHGDFGEGTGRWPILAGGMDTLTEERPEKTIGSYWPYLSTVYDYVRRAMPFGNARSLSDDDVYAITAYLLYLNDLVDEDFTLSSDNFSSIALPNEQNFIADNRLEEAFRQSSEPCMSNCADEPAVVLQRARVLDVTPEGN